MNNSNIVIRKVFTNVVLICEDLKIFCYGHDRFEIAPDRRECCVDYQCGRFKNKEQVFMVLYSICTS